MTSGVELATAYVTLVPTFKGGGAEIQKQIAGGTEAAAGAAGTAGEKGGKAYSGGFSSSIKNLAKTVGLIWAGEKVFDFLKEGAKDASLTEKSIAGLERTMDNLKIPKETIERQDAFLTKLSNASGITKEDLIPAYQKAVAATGSIVKGHQALNDAMNLSAATGIKLTAAVKAVTNGFAGNTGVLKKYGITAKDANGLQAQLNQRFGGDWKASASTAAGEYSRLTTEVDNLRETVGEKLIPVMTKLVGVLANNVVPAVAAVGGWVKKNSDWIKPLAVVILSMVAAWQAYVKIAAVVQAVQKAWGAVMAVFDAEMDANPIGLVVIAVAALAAGLIYAYKNSQTFRDLVNGAFQVVSTAASFMWEKVLKPTFKFIGDMWLEQAYLIVKGADIAFGWIPFLKDKLKSALDAITNFRDQFNNRLDGVHRDISISVHVKVPDIAGLVAAAARGMNGKVGNVSTTTDVITNNPALAGIKKRANGGPVFPGQIYQVNERGVELFQPLMPGRVIPAGPSATLMRGSATASGVRISRDDLNYLAELLSGRPNVLTMDDRTAAKVHLLGAAAADRLSE